ncbi:MAG: helix-turn-helix domain-containing protein, partial [Tidjanibacter sp.]|nr:helix-turn-helix domain-containing protein [Tidjanibacter sp.]
VFDEPLRPLSKEDVQREAIVKALRRNGGKRKDAAKELFMSERTLYRKIKDLGIDEI